MKQLIATLALIATLIQAEVVYPQAMTVHAVEEGDDGNFTVTLRSASGLLYDVVTDMDDLIVGDMMAVLMYDNMTANDIRDDAVIAMRYTGFSEGEYPPAVKFLES